MVRHLFRGQLGCLQRMGHYAGACWRSITIRCRQMLCRREQRGCWCRGRLSDAVSAHVAPRNGGASVSAADGAHEASEASSSSFAQRYHAWMLVNVDVAERTNLLSNRPAGAQQRQTAQSDQQVFRLLHILYETDFHLSRHTLKTQASPVDCGVGGASGPSALCAPPLSLSLTYHPQTNQRAATPSCAQPTARRHGNRQ
jgi:hypothetical protein